MAVSGQNLDLRENSGNMALEDDSNKTRNNIYKRESEEWGMLNKQLHTHGLLSVELVDPVGTNQLSEIIVLSVETSQALRSSVATLLRDCGRRQELLQELIVTNNQLREELGEQTRVSERLEAKNRDLRVLLDSTRDRLQEFEEERLNTSTSTHQSSSREALQHAQQVVALRCEQLQLQCKTQEEEIQRLQRKLQRMIEEDESRQTRHSEAFSQLKHKAGRHSSLDYKLIDIIDSYERQIHTLRKKRTSQRESSEEDGDPQSEETTPNYQALLQALEKQLQELNKKLKKAENENELLRLELQGRPELKDLREWQLKVQKLERSVKKRHVSEKLISEENQHTHTHVTDLDHLPPAHCRKYLKLICEKLNVSNLETITPKIQELSRSAEAQPRLEQVWHYILEGQQKNVEYSALKFARDVLQVVDSSTAPRPTQYRNLDHNHSIHEVWCDRSWHHVLPTLAFWSSQLGSLKELQQSLQKLVVMTMPWRPISTEVQDPLCTELIEKVDTILFEEKDMNFHQKQQVSSRKCPASQVALQGMVDHFMNLFDIEQLSGVYPRMNDIYMKLGEVHNVMRTLKSLIGLAEDAHSNAVVDSVGKLCEAHNSVTSGQLKDLLNVDDLDSVKRRLEEHEEFFPIFQEVMTQLMQILGVSRMEQIISAVRDLKILEQT